MKFRLAGLVIALVFCASMLAAQAPAGKTDEPKKQEAADAKKPAGEEAKKPEPPKDKAFADIVKDAEVIKGLFTLYRTEEKVYLEILPSQFDKMYMLSLTCESGIGEAEYATMMCGDTPIMFHKQAKNVQLLAKNVRFTAAPGTPEARAVARSFSDSILGMTKIESLPHPDRKSVLIDLGALLLTDLPMVSYDLEANFRIGYRLDAKNSYFGMLKSFEKNTEIETVTHYATERPPLPPLLAPGQTPPPMPAPPRNLPDVRSMILHFRYSLYEMPDAGYRPRLADDRVGHFFEQHEDYSTDKHASTATRYINRWRLEKADPSASLSPPKKPIVYWLENSIPVKYRDAVRDGVLMWNKAFEKIGFKDAIEVRQQPDDADWDPADIRYNTLRWFAGHPDPGFAIGPSTSNPVTGEIINADISFSESMTRFFRREAAEEIQPVTMPWEYLAPRPFMAPWSSAGAQAFCDLAQGSLRDAEFAADLLMARGMDPEGPEAEKFIKEYIREIAAHEVGHTLGLRHNFRASTIHSLEQDQDADLTHREGLTGSVMDYIPTNIALRGAKQGEFHQSTLGPYDYWAIEYAYKPINASSPEGERAELAKIASRSADPLLAYDTDEDTIGAGFDMDPVVNRFDLGSDPLKYYAHRVALGKEIVANMESKLEKPGEGYQILRRSFQSALGQEGQGLFLSAKYIGGVYQYRSHVGDPGDRLPFQPVAAAKQREVLNLLRDDLFSPQAFQYSARLMNKLNRERFPDWTNFGSMMSRADVPIHSMVLSLQRAVLDRLYNPVVLNRVLDSEATASSPADMFTIGMLFNTLQDAIWAETKGAADAPININSYRRSLQREHLRRMIAMVVRDGAAPEDARTMARYDLVSLREQLQGALARKGSLEARAHLSESIARIDEALKANIQRTAF
jgi:hypothetical protein